MIEICMVEIYGILYNVSYAVFIKQSYVKDKNEASKLMLKTCDNTICYMYYVYTSRFAGSL